MNKKRLILSLWILIGITVMGLFIVAANSKSEKYCKGVNINTVGTSRYILVDQKGIMIQINEYGGKANKPINSINLRTIESNLKKDTWIKDAKLYFDNNQILQVRIQEREPMARVFTVEGQSFFIDSAATRLPINKNVLARVPVFTGFPSNKDTLSKPDSTLLIGVKQIANYILRDTFWTAFVSQININSNGHFQIIPIVGDVEIDLGNAEDIENKFDRLYSFYNQVISKTGIGRYSNISVAFKGQVVASTFGQSQTPLAATEVKSTTEVSKK